MYVFSYIIYDINWLVFYEKKIKYMVIKSCSLQYIKQIMTGLEDNIQIYCHKRFRIAPLSMQDFWGWLPNHADRNVVMYTPRMKLNLIIE